MRYRVRIGLFLSAAIVALAVGVTSVAYAASESYHLENGMQVILKENHNSPMVASMVFVKSGSKYESRYENGITHFLEHLLFDGTANLSREEIDGSIRDLGGYINAFTRKELTAYFVLLPKQYIDYGMAVQADMLFNSIIPESELPKERKVVIEEIKRGNDAPGAAAEAFFIQHAYAGTPYARPVLGYQAFIENIPRAAIVAYWKKYYIPSNMTLLVIGDFRTDSMKTMVSEIMGQFSYLSSEVDTTSSPSDTGKGVGHAEMAGSEIINGDPLNGQLRFDTLANVNSVYINFSFKAPPHTDPDYLPFDLMANYLALDAVSPLKKALTTGADPMADEVSVNLVTYEEFSRLEISVVTSKREAREYIVSTVLDQMQEMQNLMADPEAIAGIKTSVKTEHIYNADKLHYYGFIISPMIFTTGWDFIQEYPELLAAVGWSACQKAARRWLSDPEYVLTLVGPMGDSDEPAYSPPTMSEREVTAYFTAATFPNYDLKSNHQMTFPPTDSVKFVWTDDAKYTREVLDNGLTVLIKSSPSSRVFAINVLGKDRSAMEPEGLTGITDFVNRCLERGTLTRDAEQLSRALAGIGANVTLYDNPWIPYDDRYTTRRFSFVKFETIDEFARTGAGLLYDMLMYPAFDSSEVENVRQNMLGILARQSESPRDVAGNLWYATAFANGPYAKPIMGTPETVTAIRIADLRDYHRRYYAPNNIILSVSSSRPASEVLGWLRETFGRIQPVEFEKPEIPEPEPITGIEKAHEDLEKEQIYLYLGGMLPSANSPDAAALQVATAILSDRLYLNLREKEGLAYSVGAGAVLDRSFGWYYAAMGTGSENYQKALDGIVLQILKLKLDGPTPDEVKKARNQIWGRLMSAKLSRINQAYYLGIDEYLGREIDYDPEFLAELAAVDVQAVRRVAAVYFNDGAYVLATAGKLREGTAGK